MSNVSRRDFMRMVALAGAGTAAGCSQGPGDLIPYIVPPENVVPGEASWFASTCRECPAGCGLLAKNRDTRIIKVEGNPLHPISGGKLCPRGQASLQGLYNPDRFTGPMRGNGRGDFERISWDLALATFIGRVHQLSKDRRSKVVLVTELMTGTVQRLVKDWMDQSGFGGQIVYEPYAYEGLRTANRIVFGRDALPIYRIDQADFLISFNTPFLETWISNVEYARRFAAFHAPKGDQKHFYVFVGPRNSLTSANADQWVETAPGDEYLIALGMLRVILDENGTQSGDQKALLTGTVADFPLEKVCSRTAVPEGVIRNLARRFARAGHPLALANGLPQCGPNATDAAVAAGLLNLISTGTAELIDFNRASSLDQAAPAREMKELSERMGNGEIEILLIHGANPVFSLPPAWRWEENIRKVPTVVSFSSWIDETTMYAHLVLPSHTFLESWGDYVPQKGILNLLQPVMGHLFDTRNFGDILLSLGRKTAGEKFSRWKDFKSLLQDFWREEHSRVAPDKPFDYFWWEALRRGGVWEKEGALEGVSLDRGFDYTFPQPATPGPTAPYQIIIYPTIQFYDGRTANRAWMQELPDPLTQTTWGGWVEIHPETAEKSHIGKGDVLRIESPYGAIEAPAIPIFTVPPGRIAIPIGQGHTAFGRYATGLPANPFRLFPPEIDSQTGGMLHNPFSVTLKKSGWQFPVAHTDGSYYDHHREIIEKISFREYRDGRQKSEKPEIDMPLPSGYDPRRDFYAPHPPAGYRWCMVVDLDRCIGCGACAVACYAENNLAVVGREQVLNQREMSWLTVQRYFEQADPTKVRFLVMLCQHCTEAPCESVCPVFAPQHSVEGLNNQVYNRCIGTRDCSQSDPYKVRRFNFFTYRHPSPLNLQLNPDVTVRQKGVMEKCSFCVQRIIAAKIQARKEGRKVRDGDFTTACAQTCPTQALTFGSLLDPESRVSKLVQDTRAYQVLRQLNTKPAAIYLKKITMDL